jgi:hypothetical protein
MILSAVRYPRQEQIDKYEVATLISALLALIAYHPLEEDPATTAVIDTFTDDPDDQKGGNLHDGTPTFSDL